MSYVAYANTCYDITFSGGYLKLNTIVQALVIKIHGNVNAQIHCLLNAGRGVNLLFHTARFETSVIYCIVCLLMEGKFILITVRK